MDIAELDVNAVCLGILCNFPQFCGEERAKEAVELVRALYAEQKALRTELARVTAERDAAVKKYEAEKEDFLDYALSGTQNAAPFCTNRHPDCVDKRGWCIPVKCHGFSRDEED